MGEVPDDVEPLLAELTTLMEHLERTSGFPDAVGLDHAKLAGAASCSRSLPMARSALVTPRRSAASMASSRSTTAAS